MAYNEIGYHGTRQTKGENILRDGFVPSFGERHWLGDGVYFFTEAFHAYKWRYDAHHAFVKKSGSIAALDCCIIKARIHTADERVYDLTKYEHVRELRNWHEQIEKLKPRSTWAKKAVPEGVVLNYMFNESGIEEYREQFDVVKAPFYLTGIKYSDDSVLPSILPQTQLCVKNERTPAGELTIQDVTVYNDQHDRVHLEELRESFEAQKQQGTRLYNVKQIKRNKGTGKYRKS